MSDATRAGVQPSTSAWRRCKLCGHRVQQGHRVSCPECGGYTDPIAAPASYHSWMEEQFGLALEARFMFVELLDEDYSAWR